MNRQSQGLYTDQFLWPCSAPVNLKIFYFSRFPGSDNVNGRITEGLAPNLVACQVMFISLSINSFLKVSNRLSLRYLSHKKTWSLKHNFLGEIIKRQQKFLIPQNILKNEVRLINYRKNFKIWSTLFLRALKNKLCSVSSFLQMFKYSLYFEYFKQCRANEVKQIRVPALVSKI